MTRRTPSQAAPESAEGLSDYWTDVAPQKSHKRAIRDYPRPIEAFFQWVLRLHTEDRLGTLALPGRTQQIREAFFRQYLDPAWEAYRPDTIEDVLGASTRNWLTEGVLPNFTNRVANALFPTSPDTRKSLSESPGDRWSLLWSLILTEDFLIEEPLRSLVDREYHLAHVIYKTLWEARFLARERQPASRDFIASLTRWLTSDALSSGDIARLDAVGIRKRIEVPAERSDALLFLLTLAQQNALYNRAIFVFDDLDHCIETGQRDTLRQLESFLSDVDRWVKLGCPVGIVLGLDPSPTNMKSLRQLNSKLYTRVKSGLEWTM